MSYFCRTLLAEASQIEAKVLILFGVPNRIRTGVAAVKGRCPRPLDDGDVTAAADCI
jgi:hypothetical protein